MGGPNGLAPSAVRRPGTLRYAARPSGQLRSRPCQKGSPTCVCDSPAPNPQSRSDGRGVRPGGDGRRADGMQ
ncbi:hypothetical protein SAM23877_4934 [Streptomyces ambofaciens ATCC 23877]|uniref:Uncharacterized protein n=1 Tax=Streptomyces ambofaciens (strain ATCC 23877 / 3486 / DSM 40053 / JCM 4204 / NBRC 12836 / NRRL B-2516) TaxID=278992 RepID=A0A0K2AY72_STRA7|nr:hypothetical protein SAM23877_4934 [Streptomyces ambofaciens ATCC 23877]